MLPFLSVALQEAGTIKAIFWSVTVYNNNVSSQCNFTAQINPVKDTRFVIVYFKNRKVLHTNKFQYTQYTK
jgi:hypothetical protein